MWRINLISLTCFNTILYDFFLIFDSGLLFGATLYTIHREGTKRLSSTFFSSCLKKSYSNNLLTTWTKICSNRLHQTCIEINDLVFILEFGSENIFFVIRVANESRRNRFTEHWTSLAIGSTQINLTRMDDSWRRMYSLYNYTGHLLRALKAISEKW